MLHLSSFFSKLGIILMVLGFSFLSYAMWPDISFHGKLFLLFFGFPILYFLGWFFLKNPQLYGIGDGLIFSAALLYGFSLWRLGYLINRPFEAPIFLSIWFMGLSFFSFSYRSFLLSYLKFFICIGIIFMLYSSQDFTGYPLFLLIACINFFLGYSAYKRYRNRA